MEIVIRNEIIVIPEGLRVLCRFSISRVGTKNNLCVLCDFAVNKESLCDLCASREPGERKFLLPEAQHLHTYIAAGAQIHLALRNQS